ncbi:hypothetical protein BD289DRAFT_84230 [Coniella lustricola]|uniref:Uncharacterized protein n=1 Tax=Coniella lustricola TaxID=2025994 RepID=A0A2T3AHE1_9PEZI|nr:hypothetical protein BD289DRAFT_84230 [Coniella lustricola]
MSYPTQQIFRPVEANVDLSQLQFSQYPNQHLQVADYSQIEFLQPSDSEEEMGDEAMSYSYETNASGVEEAPQSPASPTSASAPSKKTLKNKAKKAKQKAKAKEKKAAAAVGVADGDSAPSSRPQTPMSPLSSTSPLSPLSANDTDGTSSSKSKSKKKKKSKKSSTASPTPAPASEKAIDSLDGKLEEPTSVAESQVEQTEAAEPSELTEPVLPQETDASPGVSNEQVQQNDVEEPIPAEINSEDAVAQVQDKAAEELAEVTEPVEESKVETHLDVPAPPVETEVEAPVESTDGPPEPVEESKVEANLDILSEESKTEEAAPVESTNATPEPTTKVVEASEIKDEEVLPTEEPTPISAEDGESKVQDAQASQEESKQESAQTAAEVEPIVQEPADLAQETAAIEAQQDESIPLAATAEDSSPLIAAPAVEEAVTPSKEVDDNNQGTEHPTAVAPDIPVAEDKRDDILPASSDESPVDLEQLEEVKAEDADVEKSKTAEISAEPTEQAAVVDESSFTEQSNEPSTEANAQLEPAESGVEDSKAKELEVVEEAKVEETKAEEVKPVEPEVNEEAEVEETKVEEPESLKATESEETKAEESEVIEETKGDESKSEEPQITEKTEAEETKPEESEVVKEIKVEETKAEEPEIAEETEVEETKPEETEAVEEIQVEEAKPEETQVEETISKEPEIAEETNPEKSEAVEETEVGEAKPAETKAEQTEVEEAKAEQTEAGEPEVFEQENKPEEIQVEQESKAEEESKPEETKVEESAAETATSEVIPTKDDVATEIASDPAPQEAPAEIIAAPSTTEAPAEPQQVDGTNESEDVKETDGEAAPPSSIDIEEASHQDEASEQQQTSDVLVQQEEAQIPNLDAPPSTAQSEELPATSESEHELPDTTIDTVSDAPNNNVDEASVEPPAEASEAEQEQPANAEPEAPSSAADVEAPSQPTEEIQDTTAKLPEQEHVAENQEPVAVTTPVTDETVIENAEEPSEQLAEVAPPALAQESISNEPTTVATPEQPGQVEGADNHIEVLSLTASPVATGSTLVIPALACTPDHVPQEHEPAPQDVLSRDISESIPTAPSTHDLPHSAPTLASDAATTVELAKKSPSAGSQYGTFNPEQQSDRERVSDVTESSARSIKDVVVKDEVVGHSFASTSTTSDTLEQSKLEPASSSADGDSDPVAAQTDGEHNIGSGNGNSDGDDHDVDAVVGDTTDDIGTVDPLPGLEDDSKLQDEILQDTHNSDGLPNDTEAHAPSDIRQDEDTAIPENASQTIEDTVLQPSVSSEDHTTEDEKKQAASLAHIGDTHVDIPNIDDRSAANPAQEESRAAVDEKDRTDASQQQPDIEAAVPHPDHAVEDTGGDAIASGSASDEAVVTESEPAVNVAQDLAPQPERCDSSTQTDELWRPKTPLLLRDNVAAVAPTSSADQADGSHSSQDNLSKTAKAGEAVAVDANSDASTGSPDTTSDRVANASKDSKQHGTADYPPSPARERRRHTGDSGGRHRVSANRLAGVERTTKDDRAYPPRTRSGTHGSRSSRPSTRDGPDGTPKSLHRHSSHRHRHEGDRDGENENPQTPPRTAESGHGSHRSRRGERTPQEQAEHDKRKEERRLARKKEEEVSQLQTESPSVGIKGKDSEGSPAAERRSSRRPSSSRRETAPASGATAPPQASKKFFDFKGGESVLDNNKFGGPLDTDTAAKEGSLKRTSTTASSKEKSFSRSLSQSDAKLQKARADEAVKASNEKDKGVAPPSKASAKEDSKNRDDKHRRSRMERRESQQSNHKEEKEKKKSGGLKGMFKRMFSS